VIARLGTSLHILAGHNDTVAMTVFIEAGADVNEKNSDDITPLVVAACNGYREAVLILSMYGASRSEFFFQNGLKYTTSDLASKITRHQKTQRKAKSPGSIKHHPPPKKIIWLSY
jgi:hypothetical protein